MDFAAASVFSEIDSLVESQKRSPESDITLPATIIDRLQENGLRSDELQRIVGPREQIVPIVARDGVLPTALAERVSRLAHVVNIAEAVFGAREKAFLWLRAQNVDLAGRPPIELIASEAGARVVEEALMRIEYGVFA